LHDDPGYIITQKDNNDIKVEQSKTTIINEENQSKVAIES